MKELLVVANWKSNIIKKDIKNWLNEFSLSDFSDQVSVLLLPPFTLLDDINSFIRINDIRLSIGAQDISPFEAGSYTGEINAIQVKEFGDYVLIGHSERRINFLETDDLINKKIEQAIKVGLKPIVCVSDLNQVKSLVRKEIIIAYEPINAIGTGNPEDPSIVSEFCIQIKEIVDTKILYGGSVNHENIKNYTNLNEIDGVLVGKASLEVASLIKLINNAV